MEITRNLYLNRLIARRHNGLVKIVTGIRRCGKSYLLFRIFYDWLRSQGVDDAHIIRANLDNWSNRHLRNPEILHEFISGRITDDGMYYILLDEIQLVPNFEEILNEFLCRPGTDIYVTGSNAHLLSKDIVTEFRGRGDEVRIAPLSFREFMSVWDGSKEKGLDEFMTYGGLPQILTYQGAEDKAFYLQELFGEAYLRDIVERNGIRHDYDLEELVNVLASGIGGLTNPKKLADSFTSEKGSKITRDTVKAYIDYLCDAFLIEKAVRYDIKGKKYIDTPFKYYFTDLGLRNARLGFRQYEQTHLMENLIFNELRIRGFNVDVGTVPMMITDRDGKRRQTQLEIDFVCNQGSRRYYIQSAWRLQTEAKYHQERAPLSKIGDSFKKLIIVGEDINVHRDESGIVTMGIYDFLLQDNPLEL